MNTEEGQRDKRILSEKRATLRNRNIKKEPIEYHSPRILIGSVLIIVFIFMIILFNIFQNPPTEPQGMDNIQKNNISVDNKVNITSPNSESSTLSSDSSMPIIKIRAPRNNSIVVDSNTPQLDFLVVGNNIEDVKLSVDDKETILVPHDENFAEINSAHLDLNFIEDFSGGAERWTSIKGDWKIVDGAYLQSNYNKGSDSEAYYPLNSTEYILEYRTKIDNFGNTLQSKLGFLGKTGSSYSLVLFAKEKKVGLFRTDTWNAIKTVDYPIQPETWYDVRLIVNKTRIDVYVNNEFIIDSNVNLFSNEGITLSSWESQVSFDDIQVYTPLTNMPHKLTIFAKNKGSNTYNSNTVYFTVNITGPTVENIRATVGSNITKKGISIRLERVNIFTVYTSIWIHVENNKDQVMPFRLSSTPAIIDNLGTQYEVLKIEKSAEIAQTDLQPKANRDGALFFERIKEGANPKKLILYVNGESFEYFLD